MQYNYENWLFAHAISLDKYTIKKHVHKYFELLLFISGDAEYAIESHKYSLSPYSLILTAPMEYHYLSFNSGKVPYERIYVQFNLEEFPSEIANTILSLPKVIKLEPTSRICRAFYKFKEYEKTFSPKENQSLFKSVLTEIVYLVSLETQQKSVLKGEEVDETTLKAIDFINAHIKEPLTINLIADGVYVSPSNLCHKFSKSMKIGIMKYVRNKKLYLADKLIREGLKPTLASQECGFNDYSTFYRAYKEAFTKAPSLK